MARAARAVGVSVRTGYRWLKRYREGDRLLGDRSSAPRHCPHRLATELIAAIEQLRRERQTGPAIARALGLARSTVSLVLRRLGLSRLALLDPRPAVIRYERERPGELIHLEIKSWLRSKASAIGSHRAGQACTICTSPSMTHPVSPIPRSCPPKVRPIPPPSSNGL